MARVRDFDHYVFTRFNIRPDRAAEPASEEWLRSRLDLFKRFTVRSMQAQTVQPDAWIVLCDTESPDWLLGELDALGCRVARVEPPFGAEKAARLANGSDRPFLLTTRIDNDDAIAIRFIETVQAAAERRQSDFEFLNVTRGVQMRDGRFYLRRDPANPFLSLIERRTGARTVWMDQHQRLGQHGPIRQVAMDGPGWLQLVHGGNLANTVRGVRVAAEKVAPSFRIDASHVETSRIALLSDGAWTAIRLAGRVMRKPSRLRWLLRVVK